jgi:hypothetical protein
MRDGACDGGEELADRLGILNVVAIGIDYPHRPRLRIDCRASRRRQPYRRSRRKRVGADGTCTASGEGRIAPDAERRVCVGVGSLPFPSGVCSVEKTTRLGNTAVRNSSTYSATAANERTYFETSEAEKRGVPRGCVDGILGDRPAVTHLVTRAVCGLTVSISEKGEGKRSDSVGRAALGATPSDCGIARSGFIGAVEKVRGSCWPLLRSEYDPHRCGGRALEGMCRHSRSF